MKYYSSDILIVNGNKIYGDLPNNFVIGYEDVDNNKAYFELPDDVSLDEYSDLLELEKEDYLEKINEIILIDFERKSLEQQQVINDMIEKENQRTTQLKLMQQAIDDLIIGGSL